MTTRTRIATGALIFATGLTSLGVLQAPAASAAPWICKHMPYLGMLCPQSGR